MNVATAVLRNHLGFYLRHVREGRRVVVTDHGRPVAQLLPLTEGADDLAGRIDEMRRDGVVTAQHLRRRGEVRPVVLHRPAVRVSRLVSQMRDER